MKTALKGLAALALLVLLLASGAFLWARGAAARTLARTFEAHVVDFPVPFPLDSAEAARLALTPEQADSAALARALERGRHLVESRYACADCHGADFGGGVMIDAPVMGRLLGPNLTEGAGSRTVDYTPADWDRIVRHGILPDGRPATMPSQDFRLMSDQELSDVIAYIRSLPPVDAEVPPPSLGPMLTFLIAFGQVPLSADVIGDHQSGHVAVPPAVESVEDFGRHLAATCTGCHGEALAGGKVPGGDPAWPAAANLTPHESGLASWSAEDFAAALRQGRRPDGRELAYPMSQVVAYTARMTDAELAALWTYLRTLPAAPLGG